MAQLKSVAAVNLSSGATVLYTVPETAPFAKLSEIIVSNHAAEQVSCKLKIFKSDIAQEVIIIPQLTLLANQNQIIALATCLNTNDKVIIETTSSRAIDVLVSCIIV